MMTLEATTNTQAKTLPLAKPLMHGFNFYAFPLAILGNYEQAQSWIHSNFMNIELYYNFLDGHVLPISPCFFNYAYNPNPWISEQRLHRDHLATFGIPINELIIDSINKGYYVFLNVDEHYLPNRDITGESHAVHDNLIFGYDKEAETFDVLGFRANGVFGTSKVSFADFEMAYQHVAEIENWNQDIRLLKFNEKASYKFDIRLVADLIEDYLLSRNTYERFYMATDPYAVDNVYGMDIYEHLKTYFRLLLDGKIWLDAKYLHMLWEHKKGMVARIQYMEENGYLDKGLGLSARYVEIESRMLVLRNILIRYSIDFKTERLEKIIDSLDAVAHDEKAILQQLIGEMRATVQK